MHFIKDTYMQPKLIRRTTLGSVDTRGFTLIELLITVAVLGVLAAIALPSYQNYVNQSRRADAKTGLLRAAQVMERNYTANNCYNKTTQADCAAQTGTDTTAPASGSNYYTSSFAAGTLTRGAFTLQVAPAGVMTGDACGTFTLTSTGVQGLTGNTLTVAECWQR